MKKLLITLTLLILVSCDNDADYIEGGSSRKKIYYFMDTRTGLCYAEMDSDAHHNLTCVPCTEEVLNLIGERVEYDERK